MRRVLVLLLVLVLLAGCYLAAMAMGWWGEHRGPGEVTRRVVPDPVRAARSEALRAGAREVEAPAGPEAKRILFGDLHVHTTFSTDAFLASLPIQMGEGAHPPADACDFARFCSGLDFWSINDHALGLTPQRWRETVESIRQCNAVSGDPERPDVVAFLGWEWTQVGATPETHWGHKNVILRGLADDEIPTRPIAAGGRAATALRSVDKRTRLGPALLDFPSRQDYYDLDRFLRELEATPICPEGPGVRELPDDCQEVAETPEALFAKLDDWGHEAVVIPHGTSWGFYTPPGADWRKQLSAAQHDPERQRLFEVFSGHGNSEEARAFRAVERAPDGSVSCPEPTEGYLPSCWRAGTLIEERCLEAGEGAEACAARAARTRQLAAEAGVAGHLVVQGEAAEDWLDAGQCTDCFLPAFNYRPGGSAQYVLALRNFEEEEGPERFRFGLIASSDNHTARPGTGYKEVARGSMSDRRGPRSEAWRERIAGAPGEPLAEPVPFDPETTEISGFRLTEFERGSSFFHTGGLVAVHAAGQGRGAIWDALQRKEVYGTSGPHILLWFDLLNPPEGGEAPMGSGVAMGEAPRFRVRAAGSFEQQPGCPDWSGGALGPERLEHLCRGECHHPSDTRRPITRIEVVRIRPQERPGEDPAQLVEDPWKRFECPPDPGGGCTAEFEDPEFAADGRDSVYYVRAIEAPKPGVNAGGLRCTEDAEGDCVEVDPCWGDYRTDPDDDCLAPHEPRAWSSPIFVDHAGARPSPRESARGDG